MWLALARLETYDNARGVLNKARQAIPTDHQIWLTAAKLEEAHDHQEVVGKLISKAISSLTRYQVVMTRETWIQEAEAAEKAGFPVTCAGIVQTTIGLGLDEEEDQCRIWMDDADDVLRNGSIETARAILSFAATLFPNTKSLWMKISMLEKRYGTPEALEDALKKAVSSCPDAEVLWLMAAKEKWIGGDVGGARQILREAFSANPDSEQVWLAAVKLEWENGQIDRARALLGRARERCRAPRVWMKSAKLERECGDLEAEVGLLDEGIEFFPTFEKFYMMGGEAYSVIGGDDDKAREYYQSGLKQCPQSIPLWSLMGKLEERTRGENKARSLFELARLRNPQTDLLWLESVRLEVRSGNEHLAKVLMSKALQECPTSGVLWAEEILTSSRSQQKAKSMEALERCGNSDVRVVTAVARLFWKDGKFEKARRWLSRAVALDPDYGDAWGAYLGFELNQEGNLPTGESKVEEVRDGCGKAEPTSGELWLSVSKSVENWHEEADVIVGKVAELIQSQQEMLGKKTSLITNQHSI